MVSELEQWLEYSTFKLLGISWQFFLVASACSGLKQGFGS